MVEENGVYKCDVCGNVVSIIIGVDIPIECCDQDMTLQKAKTEADEGKEKHVPVVESCDKGIIVKVGSTQHPMEEDHYIALIQVLRNSQVVMELHLGPGDDAQAEFCLAYNTELKARAYCNTHGLWTD